MARGGEIGVPQCALRRGIYRSADTADLTPALDRIVRHCLEKQPAERFQTARDVAFALETLSGSGSVVSAMAGVQATLPAPRRRASLVTGMGLGLALAALMASAVVVTVPVTIGRRPVYAAIDPPHGRFHLQASPALSPDGRLVAFWAPDAVEDGLGAIPNLNLGHSLKTRLNNTAGRVEALFSWRKECRTAPFPDGHPQQSVGHS